MEVLVQYRGRKPNFEISMPWLSKKPIKFDDKNQAMIEVEDARKLLAESPNTFLVIGDMPSTISEEDKEALLSDGGLDGDGKPTSGNAEILEADAAILAEMEKKPFKKTDIVQFAKDRWPEAPVLDENSKKDELLAQVRQLMMVDAKAD